MQPLHAADRLVYLVTNDLQFATHLSQQIIHFGYIVRHFHDTEKALPNFIVDQNFIALIVDISSNEDRPSEKDIFIESSRLQQSYKNIIFASEQDNQIVRLKSIRAGGAAFFAKPVNIVGLIDKLDALHRDPSDSTALKKLIIENQLAVASYYEMVLKLED